jgi:N-acetylmuramoyl-L-alanine amidase
MSNSICISSGHGAKVAGAVSILNEHNEAVRVVEKVAEYLRQLGVTVHTFHDNVSTTQSNNLSTIVGFHNSQSRELDVSVHFNAASRTDQPRGTEVLYYDNVNLSSNVSAAIASASGLKNRGGKQDKGLYFLRNTKKPAILIEVCFVDSSSDANIYNVKFDSICRAIAETLSGKKIVSQPVQSSSQPVEATLVQQTGTFKIKVLAPTLWYYDQPDWNAKKATVKAGEVFTVVETLVVSGSKMYKLKSGNYMTANPKYVQVV